MEIAPDLALRLDLGERRGYSPTHVFHRLLAAVCEPTPLVMGEGCCGGPGNGRKTPAASAEPWSRREQTHRIGMERLAQQLVVTAFLRWRDMLTLERLAAARLFVTVAMIACLMPVQSDTWWQLRAGKDFWQSGAIPLQDTYSHTANGQFWMNHEWLSEVLFYGLFHLGGLPLVTALAALLVIASVGLSWSLMTGSTLLKLALMGAAVSTLSIAWTPRPHVFTLFTLQCVRSS